MTARPTFAGSPKLPFLLPDNPAPGMQVEEIDLEQTVSPSAPFKASRFTVEPGCSSEIDSHLVREMWMVARGKGRLACEDQVLDIKAGDVLYYDSFQNHKVTNDGAETLVVFSIWWASQ